MIGHLIKHGQLLYFGAVRNVAVVRSALIYLTTAALTAGVPLLLLPFLTRVLTPDQYGMIAMFSAAVQIFGITTGLSTHGAVGMRYFDRAAIDFARYVTSCLIVVLLATALTLGLVWVTLPWLENFTRLPGSWLFTAVAFSACGAVVQIRLSIWQSSQKAAKFGLLRAAQGVIDLSCSVLLIFALGLAWQGRVAGIVFAGVAVAAYTLISLGHDGLLRLPRDSGYSKNALAFGIPLIPHVAGGMLIMMADRLLITNILDLSFAGIYLVASQVGMIFNLANDALNRAYSPRLIETLKHNDDARDETIVRLTYVYFGCLLLGAIAFGAIAPVLVGAIVGPKFHITSSIFMFIAIGHAFSGMYYMVATYIFYASRTSYLAVLTGIAGAFNLAITSFLLKRDGLVGAAEAFMITQLLFFLGAWGLAQRCRPMPWFRAFNYDVSSYAKAGVIGAAMFAYASVFVPPAQWDLFARSRDSFALIDAARDGNVDLITEMLSRGAKVDIANEEGVTPLIAASANLRQDAVELLLLHRASISLRTKEGYTAYDFAKNQSNDGLARILIDPSKSVELSNGND